MSPPVSAALPVGAPAPAPVTTRRSREADADQQNWIFRDARSASSVRKALGVETAELNRPSAAERDSVAVIQEYFARQRSQNAGVPTALTPRSNPAGTGFAGSPGGVGLSSGGASFGESGNQKSGNVFGESSFPNTLNSGNTAVRRYFRELYANPNPAGPGLDPTLGQPPNTPAALLKAAPPSIAAETTRSPSFQDLADRAAFVDSLTPATTLVPGIGATPPIIPPSAATREAPTVNNGTLFERRNGLIEIPGRKF